MKFRSGSLLWIVCVSCMVLSGLSSAWAEETEFVPTETLDNALKQDEGEKGLKNGWHFRLKPSSSFMFSDSNNVIGQTDGYTLTFALNLDSEATMKKDKHEWRNTLSVAESITRTPVLEQFVIDTDSLLFESMYLYSIYDWFGVYGRFALHSSLFPDYDYQASPVAYLIVEPGKIHVPKNSDHLKLANSFSPLVLKQSAGPFFRPVEREEINVEIMLGLGAWENFSDGVRIVKDDDTTPELEVAILENLYQVGGENIIKIWGDLLDKKIGYLARSELMMPFYESHESDAAEGLEKMNVDISLRVDFRIVEWMSLAYEFSAVREPAQLNEWQVRNMILATLSYALYEYVAFN